MTTGNMELDLPVVGSTLGPAWATKINAALERISDHTHTLGDGSAISQAAVTISSDLSFNSYSAIDLVRTGYTDQTAVLADSNIETSVYSVGGNMFWRTLGGVDVQITDGSGLNLSSLGTIGGDYGGSDPASVIYTNATKIYSFFQESGITASVLMGTLRLSNQSSGSGVVQIQAGASTASYSLSLPSVAPSVATTMQVSGSGAITFSNTFTTDATFASDVFLSTAGGSGTSATAPRILVQNGNVGDSFFLGMTGNKIDTTNPAGVAHALIVSSGPTYAIYGSVNQVDYDSLFSIGLDSGIATMGESALTQPHRMYGGLRFENTYLSGMTYGIAKSSSTILSLYNNANAIVNVGATSVGIAAAATIDFANSAGSYTAPKLLAQNNNADVTGWGVYRNGTSPSGIGALATASNARLYYTADGGTTPLSLINVVAATGVISLGNGTHDSVAHNLSGSLNFGSTAALPTNGIGRSGSGQLSITTSSTERIRVTDSAVTIRNAFLCDTTATFTGAVDVNSTADFQGAVNFQAVPTGTITGGNYSPTITMSYGTFGSLSKAQYQRIGNIVTVNLQFTVVSNGSSSYGFVISLPVARTAGAFSGSNEGWGTIVSGSSNYEQVGQSDPDIFGIIAIDGTQTIGMTSFFSAGGPSQTRYCNVQMTYQLDN